jgi:hypothetical protein
VGFTDEIAADLLALESEFNQSFNWNGGDYPCVTGSLRRSRSLTDGGFSLDADLVIYVRASLFGTRPESKERLTFNSRTYRIEEVIVPATEPFLKLVCNDANRSL